MDPVPAPTRIIRVPAGPEAHRALHTEVWSAKATDALAPVTIVVSSNFVGLAARRELASNPSGPESPNGSASGSMPPRIGIAGVDFLTPFRLAELHGAASLAGQGRRPVSTPVIAAAVRGVLQSEPGYFERVRDHPTTERRLVMAHRELSELNDSELDSLAAAGDRAAEVVRVHRSVRSSLAPSWYEEQDLVSAAISALERDPELAAQRAAVIVFLPTNLARSHAAMLRALGTVSPLTAIVGTTGSTEADADADAAVLALAPNAIARAEDPGNDLLPAGVARERVAPARLPSAAQVSCLSVSDADEEIRHVVRGIVAAAQAGVPYDRMAVVYASERPYLRLLHDQLTGAGIPFNGQAVDTLAESPFGRLLLGLLALPDRDFRREDVIGLISSTPIRWRGRVAPARAWDDVSRKAGVVRGVDQWSRHLDTLRTDIRLDIDRFGDDPEYESRVRHLERTAADAVHLEEFVRELAQLVARVTTGSWASRVEWCRSVLEKLLGPATETEASRQLASDRIQLTLSRLAGLDSIDPEATLQVFRRTLEAELESGLGRLGTFGNGVLVGPASVTNGLTLDRVWVVGMAEGLFPSRRREDSLLPDRDRQRAPSLKLLADRTHDEHRQFLLTLAAVEPAGAALLSYPRGDLRQSSERAPSRWLVELARRVSGDNTINSRNFEDLGPPLVKHVASFASGVANCEMPPTRQEYDLRSLVEAARKEGGLRNHPLLAGNGQLALAASALDQRTSASFTRFDGNLPEGMVTRPGTADSVTSATALETWAKCPHQYFVRYLLGVDPLETPERRLRIDPLSRGTLLHRVLERFVSDLIEEADTSNLHANDRERRLMAIAEEEFARTEARGLTGEAIYWHRDQTLLRRELGNYLHWRHDRDIESGATPLRTEMGFGLQGEAPVSIPLPHRPPIHVRGSIDLVEQLGDGSLAVIDYKSGSRAKIDKGAPHAQGTRLQLVLYALAARQRLDRPNEDVFSGYWYLRPSKSEPVDGYEVTDDVTNEVLSAVETIIDGIEAGLFPQNPDPTTRLDWIPCQFCDPDGLGVGEAHRRFLRKFRDQRLEPYLDLAHPDRPEAQTRSDEENRS